MKQCKKCHIIYPLSDFHKSTLSKDGLRWRCKNCASEYGRQRLLERTPEQKQATRDRRHRYAKRYPETVRIGRLRRQYKMTPEQYAALLQAQGGVCAICCLPNSENRDFHVDHDHSCCPTQFTCGKCIRGLLCRGCNHGLGNFHESTPTMERAVKYLHSFSKASTE